MFNTKEIALEKIYATTQKVVCFVIIVVPHSFDAKKYQLISLTTSDFLLKTLSLNKLGV